jgi:glycosyltransferase involved in cell wall biosynthesis
MNVAFILWGVDRFGGMERRYVRLASELMLSHSELNVFIFCHKDAANQVRSFLPSDHHSRVIEFIAQGTSNRFLRLNKLLFNLRRKLIDKSIHHLHLINNPGHLSFYILFFSGFIKRKSLVMADSTYETNSSLANTFSGNLSLFFYDRVDCLSGQTKNILIKKFYHLHFDKYHEAPCSFTDLSKAQSANERSIDLVMMARFVSGKGYELIENALQSIQGYNLLCYGSGPCPPKIPSKLISFTENPFNVLSKTKVFLSLQRVNNYPSQSILEAIACGAAIIATDVGETRNFLDDDCAILINLDVDELILAIKKLLSDEELRLSLAENARKKVLGNHSIERYSNYFCEDILSVY